MELQGEGVVTCNALHDGLTHSLIILLLGLNFQIAAITKFSQLVLFAIECE